MAIKKVNGAYVASSRGVWIPGVFEDERTARFAFRLTDAVLAQLQHDANLRAGGRDGVLTWGDLARASDQARQKTPEPLDHRPERVRCMR